MVPTRAIEESNTTVNEGRRMAAWEGHKWGQLVLQLYTVGNP